MNRRRTLQALTALSAGSFAPLAFADNFPSRPIRVIVPFPPGQASDIIARMLGERVSGAIGQTVVVENRPGAGGNIGTEGGARAAKDGYTLTMATAALPISKHVYRKLPFDPVTDFEPVVHLTITPLVLITSPKLAAKSVRELVAYAKANPGKLTFASSGVGTSHHLSGELFKALTDTDLLHVAYKGSAAAHVDLISGQVDLMFDNIVAVQNNVRQGKLNALAVTTKTRASSLPDVPTMQESGMPNFEAVAWFGLLAPKGTPQPIVTQLNAEFGKALALPEIRQRLNEMGAQTIGGDPASFGRFFAAEVAKWDPVVKRAKISLD